MTTNIYDQAHASFRRVSAYVVMDGGQAPVARIAIKWPKDGMGRLQAYCHFIRLEMVKGTVSGCGYDKATTAIVAGFAKAKVDKPTQDWQMRSSYLEMLEEQQLALKTFQDCLVDSEGKGWIRSLEDAGYRVIQAV